MNELSKRLELFLTQQWIFALKNYIRQRQNSSPNSNQNIWDERYQYLLKKFHKDCKVPPQGQEDISIKDFRNTWENDPFTCNGMPFVVWWEYRWRRSRYVGKV